MEHRVEVLLDEALVKRAHLAFVRRDFNFTFEFFIETLAIFAALSAVGFLFGGMWRNVGIGIFVFGFCLALWHGWSVYLLLRDKIRRSRRILSRLSQPLYRYYFSEEGIRVETELGSSRSAWKSFPRLSRFPGIWLLFTNENEYCVLPVAQMSSDARQLIERKCREHKIPVS